MEIPGAVIRQRTDFGDATGLGKISGEYYPPFIDEGTDVISQTTQQIGFVSCFPNPAKNKTTIRYYLCKNQPVELMIFYQVGAQIDMKTLVQGTLGMNEMHIDLVAFPPGVYIYRLRTPMSTVNGKIVVE